MRESKISGVGELLPRLVWMVTWVCNSVMMRKKKSCPGWFGWSPVSVLEYLVSQKKSWFWFRKICSKKKVSVSFLENLVSEKTSRFRLKEFGRGKKSPQKIWSKKNLGFGFGKLDLGKEKKNNKKETRPSKQCKSLI